MRLIGHLPGEGPARVFSDYLVVEGIENHVEPESGERWAVWVADEDQLERATALLEEFQRDPSAEIFQTRAKGAADVRAGRQRDLENYRRRLQSRRHLFRPLTGYGFGLLTYGLIVGCVIVAIRSNLGGNMEALLGLFISEPTPGHLGSHGLPELLQGEVWRLVTPIFIHFGLIHIICNMLWLRDLGCMIEARQSSWHLLGLVLAFAIGSNLAQFYVSGPLFGGMSGVVYGLLGYVWIRGKFDPASGLYVHPSTVTMMIVWFFVCLSRLLGPIANTAHAVGLGMGMAWGYLSCRRVR